MIFQSTNYTCGPAAVVNACRVLGYPATEKQATLWCRTTPKSGTDQAGIVSGLWRAGLTGVPFETKDEYHASQRLEDRNLPLIICVNGWDHWVTVIGHTADDLGLRSIVIDSANTIKNRRTNGVHVYAWEDLKKIWGHGRRKKYAGVSVRT